MSEPPRLFLVTGIPGAGKTTVGRLLAERFERGVFIEADVLHGLIVRGARWPDEAPRDDALRQLELRAKNAALLAANFFDDGFTVVIDDVVIGRERLGVYERALSARPLELVVLAPGREVAASRDLGRGHKYVGDRFGDLDAEQRAGLAGRGLWVDTGRMSPEETVDAILRAAPGGPS